MDYKKNQAIYLQIGEIICEYILTGSWPVTEKISSVREFAAMMEVNPNTVMRTYTYLQDKGIIYNKRGIGFFVSKDAVKLITERERKIFLEQELPQLFKRMHMLDISIKDLEKHHSNFKKK